MFKKIIFVKSSSKRQGGINGAYEWLIKSGNNFFCYSRQPLELNKWYEIIYYQAKNGFFRVNTVQLIDRQLEGNDPNQFNQQINIWQQNIFIMENQRHSGNCVGNKCYECWLVASYNFKQYQSILKERKEYIVAQEKYERNLWEFKTGFLCLNGKEIKHFSNRSEADQWRSEAKKDIQFSFVDLNLYWGNKWIEENQKKVQT
jgi:hypothetical protein